MNKFNFIILALVTSLLGCNPFNAKQTLAQEFIDSTDNTSRNAGKRYKANIRKIKPYEVYSYQQKLSDPFRARDFAIQREQEKEVTVTLPPQCNPPDCIPPEPHAMTFLENYSLDALTFVGTLTNNRQIGLIKTPDYGVVQVKIGEYMGKNNGKVIAINTSSIVLQEKLLRNGLWKNKKTVLVIRR